MSLNSKIKFNTIGSSKNNDPKPLIIHYSVVLTIISIVLFLFFKFMLLNDYSTNNVIYFNLEYIFLYFFIIFSFFLLIYLYVFAPFRILYFWVSRFFINLYLKKEKINKNILVNSLIIIGLDNFKNFSYQINPNYNLEIITILEYLKIKKEKYGVYFVKNVADLDKIMKSSKVNDIYLLGHGIRHGFSFNQDLIVNYCRYKNYTKNLVYQLHCNSKGGNSLAEYVLSKNKMLCVPNYYNLTESNINNFFMLKIKETNSNNRFIIIKLKLFRIITILIVVIILFLIIFLVFI